MNTKTITMATMLTASLMLGGCNSSKKDNDSESSGLNLTLEQFLVNVPVVTASDNTLADTPEEIDALVSDFDIDARNSAYLILQGLNKSIPSQVSGKKAELNFCMLNILYPYYDDPGVANAMAKDYNDCIKSVGIDELNKGGGRNCSDNFGITWKQKVENKLLSSTSLQTIVYEWIKPELKRVVNGLAGNRRTYMKNALSHMIAYTDNYNHQAEKIFYNECCNSRTGERLFVYTGKIVNMNPVDDEVVNPYRFLETWVYRRVENGQMSASQINKWLRQIKDDVYL